MLQNCPLSSGASSISFLHAHRLRFAAQANAARRLEYNALVAESGYSYWKPQLGWVSTSSQISSAAYRGKCERASPSVRRCFLQYLYVLATCFGNHVWDIEGGIHRWLKQIIKTIKKKNRND